MSIDWDKFILAGFGHKEQEKLAAENELQKYGPDYKPKDDELEVMWYTKDGLKYFTVVCRCGNNRMTMHEGGVRCQICGRFHSHENFNKKRMQARKISKFNDGKMLKKPQPYAKTMGLQHSVTRSGARRSMLSRDGNKRLGASTN